MLPRYAELEGARPLVYLDQNVIDAIRKKKLLGLIPTFHSDYRAVYSDETFREIKRAADGGGDAQSFLQVLYDLDAYYIKRTTDSNFVPQNEIVIHSHSPFELYDEYIGNLNLEYLLDAQTLLNQKMMGGLPNMSLSEIELQIVNAYERLLDDIGKSLDNLGEEDASQELIDSLKNELKSTREVQLSAYKNVVRQSIRAFQAQIDSSELSMLLQFRESLNVNPLHLNNIEPPNVVEQIWQQVSKNEVVASSDTSIEQFFGVTKKSYSFPDQDNAPSDHVIGVYQILNMVGYHPDKKPHNPNSFVSTSSDMVHASMGYYCSAIISCDDRFVKKTSAAYDFLNIPTRVLHIVEEKENATC